MRIISKFKDYYDYMSYLGIDNKCTYIRNTKNEHIRGSGIDIVDRPGYFFMPSFKERKHPKKPELQASLRSIEVVLCGVRYYGWKLYTREWLRFSYRHTEEIIWDLERVREVYEEYWQGSLNIQEKSDIYWKQVADWMVMPLNAKSSKFFTEPVYAFEANAIEKGGEWYSNPNLTDYDFYKVVTPEEIWQRISMWISKPKEVPETTRNEKVDLLRHGMDGMSFKRDTHPGKPRSNK